MCRTDTKQTYYVLEAFNSAGGHIYRGELVAEIRKLIKREGADSFEQLGSQSLEEILNDLSWGRMTIADEKRRWTISEDGKKLANILKGYVDKANRSREPAPV